MSTDTEILIVPATELQIGDVILEWTDTPMAGSEPHWRFYHYPKIVTEFKKWYGSACWFDQNDCAIVTGDSLNLQKIERVVTKRVRVKCSCGKMILSALVGMHVH